MLLVPSLLSELLMITSHSALLILYSTAHISLYSADSDTQNTFQLRQQTAV